MKNISTNIHNMHRSIYVFILIVITATTGLIPVSLNAQAPGYIGKRFIVSSDIQLMPSIVGWANYNEEDNFSFMNYRPGLNLEYVINRKSSVGVGFHMFNTYLSFPESVGYGGFHFTIAPERLKGTDLELSYSYYMSGLPAPLGSFIKLSYIGVRASPDYDHARIRKQIESNVPAIVSGDFTVVKSSNLSPTRTSVLAIEYGRQRIYRNAISFRYSGGMGLETSSLNYFINYDSYENTPFNEEYLDLMSKRRIFSTYLFTFKLGIGYVL